MTLNLDFISAILVGLMAVSAFSLDIVSSPDRGRWMSLPKMIRWEIRITAAMLMLRSVNLFSLSATKQATIGQVNWLALICAGCLAITIVSLVLYVLNKRLPVKAWDRISFALRTMRERPDTVPVMMDKAEVIDIHHAMGQPAVDGANPDGVPREAPRYVEMLRHSRRHGRG